MVELGNTYNSEIGFMTNETPTIDKAIHSFVNLKDAISEKKDWLPCKTVIVKCQIPIDSTYYIGMFDVDDEPRKSYASSSLKYIEIIKK